MWRRRRSTQASGGVPQNQEACGARESQNGAAGAEREMGEMQDGDGFQFIIIIIAPDLHISFIYIIYVFKFYFYFIATLAHFQVNCFTRGLLNGCY